MVSLRRKGSFKRSKPIGGVGRHDACRPPPHRRDSVLAHRHDRRAHEDSRLTRKRQVGVRLLPMSGCVTQLIEAREMQTLRPARAPVAASNKSLSSRTCFPQRTAAYRHHVKICDPTASSRCLRPDEPPRVSLRCFLMSPNSFRTWRSHRMPAFISSSCASDTAAVNVGFRASRSTTMAPSVSPAVTSLRKCCSQTIRL